MFDREISTESFSQQLEICAGEKAYCDDAILRHRDLRRFQPMNSELVAIVRRRDHRGERVGIAL
ncbi:hypothetical protein [Sphingomonas sp.]|uniref:hypothetical protein n=1 Tax=Sphingomonas sp. TaxID=28214 RepID=UPI0031D84AA2